MSWNTWNILNAYQSNTEHDPSLRSTDRQGHPAWKRCYDLAVLDTEKLFPSMFPLLSFTISIHGGSKSHFPAPGAPACSEHRSVMPNGVQVAQLWRLMAQRRDAYELMAHWQL